MRVLFSSYSGMTGHLNPYVAVVEQLRELGHEVGWLYHAGGAIPPGATPVPMGTPSKEVHDSEQTPRSIGELLRDTPRMCEWWRSQLPPSTNFDHEVDMVRKAIRAYRPDVIAAESAQWRAIAAIAAEGIPWGAICPGLQTLTPPDFHDEIERDDPELLPSCREALSRYGLNFPVRGWFMLAPRLNIAFTTRALVGASAIPDDITMVGPSIPKARRDETASKDFPWHRLRPDRPIVYVSLGTLVADVELYMMVAEAATDLGVQLVLSSASLLPGELPDQLPGDPIVVKFTPQLELLPRVSAYVTHGGANSIMEAMFHGVPLLITPYFMDQFLQAHFFDQAGSAAPGTVLYRQQFTAERARVALRELLDPDGRAVRNAQRIRASYREQNGARVAAELLLALA